MPRKDKNGLTAKQEQYARARAEGKTQRQAHKAAYNDEGMKDKTIDEAACRLETDSKVIARIEALKALTAQTAALTREDIAASLALIASDESKGDGIRLKAFDQLARIVGAYDDRQTIDVKAAVLTGRDKADAIRDFLSGMTDGEA